VSPIDRAMCHLCFCHMSPPGAWFFDLMANGTRELESFREEFGTPGRLRVLEFSE
jgi:hypothetical protein